MASPQWGKVVPVFIFVGFIIYILTMTSQEGKLTGKDNDEGALLICAYIAYILAFVLSVLEYADGFSASKLSRILVIVLCLAAGGLCITALGLHGSRNNGDHNLYKNTLYSSGALLAIVAGLCGIVAMC